ncbi:MAG: amidohydrolase family protein, partial [Acidobacteria bacterium]|nr:amidohydrolase family protein [Acidobacteriota bacterium]
MSTLHRGHVFHLTGKPTVQEAAEALVDIPDGAILVDDDGMIEWCGHHADRPQVDGAAVEVVDHGDAFLLPGFVDTHMHFPQVNSIDAYGGGQLLEWLTESIFPAEARFADEEFARGAAR